MIRAEEKRAPAPRRADISGGDRRRVLDRALGVFGEVRPGEGVGALLMLVTVFLILASYYLIKPARDGLLAVSGIEGLSKTELKAYAALGHTVVLAILVPLYARWSARLSRGDLLTRVNFAFVLQLFGFWLLQPGLVVDRIPYLGFAFYLWVGIFNVGVLAQFWSFAADLHSDGRGKRLIPVIAIGASAGAVAGSWGVQQLVSMDAFTTYTLLLFAAVVLTFATLLLRKVEARTHRAPGTAPARAAAPGSAGSLELVFRHRYLLATATFVLLLNWVSTTGENLLFGVVQELIGRDVAERGLTDATAVDRYVADGTTAFYGSFFFWTNVAALLIQALLASRIVKYGGFGLALLILPVVALLSYSATALLPVLAVVKLSKIAENAASYSIHNTASQILWLPTTSEMKYKAKAAIDTIFVRAGDGLAALTILIGLGTLGLSVRSLYAFNISLVVAWLAVAVVIVREHRRLSTAPAAAALRPTRRPDRSSDPSLDLAA